MNQGASGNKKIFIIGDKTYQTTSVPPTQVLTQKEGMALVRSGAATPQSASYIAQFPWTKPSTK